MHGYRKIIWNKTRGVWILIKMFQPRLQKNHLEYNPLSLDFKKEVSCTVAEK
jgi:hypothetical protein